MAPRCLVRPLHAMWVLCAVWATARSAPGQSCDQHFMRGDVDTDGSITVTDAVVLLQFLFSTSSGDLACRDAADINDDGNPNLSDAVFLLNQRFRRGAPLPAPSPGCGLDPTRDTIGCASYPPCPARGTSEICDGIDNDCDGSTDEDFDLARDPRNCGRCGSDCTLRDLENVVEYACVAGGCAIARCAEGFFDADGIAENGCETTFPPNGMPCNDGNPCTDNDIYLLGLCGGTPRSCSSLDDACHRGLCDPRTGDCVRELRPPGTACNDGNPRTVNDHCDFAGECVGVRAR